MSYHHFTPYERARIEAFHRLGYSGRKISKELNRHHTSINREIKRNTLEESYRAEEATIIAAKRRLNSVPKGKSADHLVALIEQRLLETWSPEQISNGDEACSVSFKTIYNWLYQGRISVSLSVLRRKGASRKKADSRGQFSVGRPIAERPKEVDTRETFANWELDTMVSSRGESKGCFATFVERKTRLYTALKIPDRSAHSMFEAISRLHDILPDNSFQTATTDRGKEFACHKLVEDTLGINVYFADPYSPWQRGSNENSNGLLREFYPKKTDLALVDQKELTHNLFLINNRPRKCLNWKSPIQAFLHEAGLSPYTGVKRKRAKTANFC